MASAIGLGLGLSPIPPYSSGIMAKALEAEFGWGRGDILGVLMIVPVVLVVLGRYVGRIVDKVGARKVAIGSTIGLGLAQLLIALIGDTLPGLYIGWAIMAVLALGTLPMTYLRVINGWFVEARGLALGLSLACTGLSGAVFPFVLTNMIETFGWRGGYVGLGAMPLLIAVPVLLAWLHEPGEARAEAARKAAETGMEVRPALRSYRFWAIAAGSLLLAFGVSGLLPNLFPLLTDRGVSSAAASSALAALALSVTGGRILSGFLLDRLWAPIVCAILVIPAIGALFLLSNPGMTASVMVASVVTLGLVAGAEFDLVAFMTGRYFGQRHFSELYGIQYAAFGLGAGFAPAAYGALYDHFGDYEAVIHLSIALLCAAVAINFTLGRYPRSFASAGDDAAADEMALAEAAR
ncbi:MFS transporter [Novosphingobium sp. YJ-S2-02]|uniref:MFS transporter n=1 Tax=Novosphingobium aureum TaxID=2792964 RepID=A0A931HE18_9SPHN|nr:MFS transporter [Novosphingobium aureum]MBH0114402.1 MFS transporter [Novosphingobium aureum]